MQAPSPTACLIVIGNEILSGRTQDVHVAWLAQELNEAGIRLNEVRIIPDDEAVIIETVNACRGRYTYLFTTGGIGPTHDDITSAAISKAVGVKHARHKEAEALLRKHYGDKINDARLRMATMPEGASLIPNPVSIAPGFRIGNVFVLAGVPSVMRAMFSYIKTDLAGGESMHSKTLSTFVTEGVLAETLGAIQKRYPDTEIGSYPFFRDGKLGTSLVIRATDTGRLKTARDEIKTYLLTLTREVMEEE